MKQQIMTKLVQIGNSKGVRLPKTVIDQVGLGGELVLEVRDGEVVLRPQKHPRAGWEQAYRDGSRDGGLEQKDDGAWLSAPNRFDQDEWEW